MLFIWAGIVLGTAAYDPYIEEIKAIDNYHLFHISPEWFDAYMIDRGFEKVGFYYAGKNSVFYTFINRKAFE